MRLLFLLRRHQSVPLRGKFGQHAGDVEVQIVVQKLDSSSPDIAHRVRGVDSLASSLPCLPLTREECGVVATVAPTS